MVLWQGWKFLVEGLRLRGSAGNIFFDNCNACMWVSIGEEVTDRKYASSAGNPLLARSYNDGKDKIICKNWTVFIDPVVIRIFHSRELASLDGKFLIRGGDQVEFEECGFDRTVVVEFKSYQDALDCYNSESYQSAMQFVINSSKYCFLFKL